MNEYAQKAPKNGPPPGAEPPRPTDTSWIRRQFCDIPYAEQSDSQRLNIYLPNAGKGPFPVVFFIHGGAFVGGDRTDPQVKPVLGLLKYGYAVVSVDYRLAGEVVFPRGIQDCKAALRFIKKNGAKCGLDVSRIAVMGDSSGANFALMLAATPGQGQFEDLSQGNADQDTTVQCAVCWFTPTDFLAMDEQFRAEGMAESATHLEPYSPEACYLGGDLNKLPEEYVRLADPTSHLTAQLPPVLLQHGTRDHVVPWGQSRHFAEQAEQICGPGRVNLELLEGADHADPLFETESNLMRVAAFLKTHLG